MFKCASCDGLRDSREDVEAHYEDAAPFRIWCSDCAEAARGGDAVASEAVMEIDKPPYPADCMSPSTCAGLNRCPRRQSCGDQP